MPRYHQTTQESKDPLNQCLNPNALCAVLAYKLVQSLRPDNLGFYFLMYFCYSTSPITAVPCLPFLYSASQIGTINGQEKCLYAARVSFLRVVILHLMHFRKGTFSVRFQPCWWRRKMCLKLFTSGQNIFAVHVGTEPSFSFQRQLTRLAHTLLDIIQSHECNENVSFQASG